MTGTTSIRLFPESISPNNKADNFGEEFISEQCSGLLDEAEISEAPVDLRLLASFRDIREIEVVQMTAAGELIPLKDGGMRVHLRATDSEERRRFSLGHEITHTFFPDYKLERHERFEGLIGEFNRKNRVECLCDFGAAQLLLPTKLFRPRIQKAGFSIEALQELSKDFRSSLEATGIKMVGQSPEDSAFVVWEEKFKPTERFASEAPMLFEEYRPKKKLRVKFGFGLQRFGYIPADKSVDDTSGVIQAAFDSSKPGKGVGRLNFGKFSVDCEIQALPSRFQDKMRLLTLLKARS
jgi:hypothetical protein